MYKPYLVHFFLYEKGIIIHCGLNMRKETVSRNDTSAVHPHTHTKELRRLTGIQEELLKSKLAATPRPQLSPVPGYTNGAKNAALGTTMDGLKILAFKNNNNFKTSFKDMQ